MNVQTNEILAMVQHIVNEENEEEPANNTSPQPVANAVVQNMVQLEMLRILRAMQLNMNQRNKSQDVRRGGGY